MSFCLLQLRIITSRNLFNSFVNFISFCFVDSTLLRPEIRYPYDVTVTRRENEGFGFVIISSSNKAGSAIGILLFNFASVILSLKY